MKKLGLVLSFFLLVNVVMAQEEIFKRNFAHKVQQEDRYNEYCLENISNVDLLKALDFMGVRIFKFDLPRTDKPRSLSIVVDEYAGLKLIKSDTTGFGMNTYHYWESGDTLVYKDYIEEMTLMTKHIKEDSTVKLLISNRAISYGGMAVKYKKESKDSFYNIRLFRPTEFKYGDKIPMVVIASSWYDKKFKINRFCGAAVLEVGDERTEELLEMSPNYYIISYILD